MVEKMVFLKVHNSPTATVIAVSDPELIGKELILSQGKRRARVKISKGFYEGKLISLEDSIEVIRSSKNVNIMGSAAQKAVEEGILHQDALIWLEDPEGTKIPHAMIIECRV